MTHNSNYGRKIVKFQKKYLLWLILTLPACGMVAALILNNVPIKDLLHPSGEFSARFMIIAMCATPLLILFQRFNRSLIIPQWLIRHRRTFGVAAFGYAGLHTLFYIIDTATWVKMVSEITSTGIWTGWLALLIFIPLGITSNNRSQQYLRTAWKKLQRWVYPAAILTLLHWIFIHNNLGPALIHFVPLAVLELFRAYAKCWEKL